MVQGTGYVGHVQVKGFGRLRKKEACRKSHYGEKLSFDSPFLNLFQHPTTLENVTLIVQDGPHVPTSRSPQAVAKTQISFSFIFSLQSHTKYR